MTAKKFPRLIDIGETVANFVREIEEKELKLLSEEISTIGFAEIKIFLEWYAERKRKGLSLPRHYGFGIGGIPINDAILTQLQLISMGARKVSLTDALRIEGIFKELNAVNHAAIDSLPVPRPDVF